MEKCPFIGGKHGEGIKVYYCRTCNIKVLNLVNNGVCPSCQNSNIVQVQPVTLKRNNIGGKQKINDNGKRNHKHKDNVK